jgi:hypothetical protein
MVQSLGVLSLTPLRSVVDTSFATQASISGLVDETGVKDREPSTVGFFVFGDLGFMLQSHSNLVQTE